MSSKKIRSIFEKVVSGPIRPMKWQDIETLLLALGAVKKEGKGASLRYIIEGRPIMFHKPHPDNELKRYVIRQIRDYLLKHNIKFSDE